MIFVSLTHARCTLYLGLMALGADRCLSFLCLSYSVVGRVTATHATRKPHSIVLRHCVDLMPTVLKDYPTTFFSIVGFLVCRRSVFQPDAFRRFPTFSPLRFCLQYIDGLLLYINRQGGTRSAALLGRTWDLLVLCDFLGISLRASHLARKDNVVADALSRGNYDSGEWTNFGQIMSSTSTTGQSSTCSLPPAMPVYRPSAPGTTTHKHGGRTHIFPMDGPLHVCIPAVWLAPQSSGAAQGRRSRSSPHRPVLAQPDVVSTTDRDVCGPTVQIPGSGRDSHSAERALKHPDPLSFHLAAWMLSGSLSKQRAFHQRLLLLQQQPAGRPLEKTKSIRTSDQLFILPRRPYSPA